MVDVSELIGRGRSLTKAQRRMLQSVADGAVARHFDVWAGYWWTEREKKLPAYGKSGNFPPLPIRYLLAGKLIFECAVERVASGTQRTKYELTPAGSALLHALDNQNEAGRG